MYRIRRDWGIDLVPCHPTPAWCRQKVKAAWKKHQSTELPLVVVTVRDPVDRYVSAFYWRLLVLCDPNGDGRPRVGGRGHHCKDNSVGGEIDTLFYRYGRDANVLAEALYDDDGKNASDGARALPARADLRTILHARHGLVDWLQLSGFDWRRWAHKIYPVVVPPNPSPPKEGGKGGGRAHSDGDDLVNQTDAAVRWLYDHLHFEDEGEFASRVAAVARKTEARAAAVARNPNSTGEIIKMHSSRKGGGHPPTGLSRKGIDNVVRFYVEDYDLLGELEELACKSDACHRNIRSILDRRKESLERIRKGRDGGR